MCADWLEVALVVPSADVFSGGVERTIKLIEYSSSAAVSYTALLPVGGIPNEEIADRFRALERAGTLRLRTLAHDRKPDRTQYDVVAVPTEFWWQAWKRAKAGGLSGPYCFDFHQLPYLGTLDILKSDGIEDPSLGDLVRVPFLQRRFYADGLFLSGFQTAACLASVRSFPLIKNGNIMAITPVVARNLASLGYRGPMFIPETPNGIAKGPVEEGLKGEEPTEFDGVYVGRFHPHKGFLELPIAVARLKKLSGRDVRVAVCGSMHFPRHMRHFQRQVQELGIGKNLLMIGRVPRPELYSIIRRSRMLLYPSFVDGFSLTVLESLCLGVPVVAYDIDALQIIWSRRRGVFRVPVGNPTALAEAASQLLGANDWEHLQKELRIQSASLLRQYTWESVVRDQRRFYETAIENRSRAS